MAAVGRGAHVAWVLLAGCGVTAVLGAPPAGSRAEQASSLRRQLQVDDRIHTVRVPHV